MLIEIYKYHGTGNDFLLIDNRFENKYQLSTEIIKNLCHRNFGIGADGLMLLSNSQSFDFDMKYFNSDGLEGTMCGNGGRCIVAFAKKLGLINIKTIFSAIDGIHNAIIDNNNNVTMDMNNINYEDIIHNDSHFIIDSGSPHYIEFVNNYQYLNVLDQGRKIRYNNAISKNGVNVNFVKILENNCIFVRTYERGVENETLSCGTGAIASAIAYLVKNGNFNQNNVLVNTFGGKLFVYSKFENNSFVQIKLVGPTQFVFKTEISLI